MTSTVRFDDDANKAMIANGKWHPVWLFSWAITKDTMDSPATHHGHNDHVEYIIDWMRKYPSSTIWGDP